MNEMLDSAIRLEKFLERIGYKLYVARHNKREKITAAANNIGISHPTLSQIENGKYKSLTIRLVFKLAFYYDLDLDEFLNFSEI